MKKEELNNFFIENSDKMLKELEKGAEIIIKKNKDNFVAYKKLISKIK